MKKFILSTLSLFIFCGTSHAVTATEKANHHFGVCLIDGIPSQQYVVVKRVKVAKGTYGSVEELYPKLGNTAKKLNADAIVDYNASQRFGFWPWRVVRPVATGTAVRWTTSNVNCQNVGGKEI
ncbi:hypothetical protein IAE19_07985 [Acinetobacter sp. S40]|uniref:hypothetical protein n=1 Tax=unclassified Acinetobacter TaxID=196816 RepID=UPI00190E0BD2|nr:MULTISPECIES: hypothetical protein [unclassified Acinetobacter]MBJ9985383.1 hypothetical protein [Acinetobacter sp. S40]MBK0063733.1 hypothetical protein [Acinetobacter sp. S55]MBK0066978.1 hypothetical protein [Acinetobacter sp. S54]